MASDGQTFFEKVTTRADRERVYNILAERKIDVLAVDEKKKQTKFVPRYLSGDKLVMAAADDKHLPPIGLCIVSFSIGVEKYFIKVDLVEGIDNNFSLDMQADLFKLQRRNSFRLNIPTGYAGRIELRTRNAGATKEKYDIVDLSGGGLAFEFQTTPTLTYKQGETVEGRLVVGPEFTTDFRGIVRHVRMVGSRGSGLCRVGVEFQDLRSSVQNEIVNLVMDLHRDMFSKFKLKSR